MPAEVRRGSQVSTALSHLSSPHMPYFLCFLLLLFFQTCLYCFGVLSLPCTGVDVSIQIARFSFVFGGQFYSMKTFFKPLSVYFTFEYHCCSYFLLNVWSLFFFQYPCIRVLLSLVSFSLVCSFPCQGHFYWVSTQQFSLPGVTLNNIGLCFGVQLLCVLLCFTFMFWLCGSRCLSSKSNLAPL